VDRIPHDPGAGGPQAPDRRRWAVLAAFSALVACTQLLWLSFAPVTPQAARALGVSEGAVGDLAGANPLLYVVLALPAGRWLDRRFGRALSAGALLTVTGALLRAVAPGTFGWVLAGQLVLAAGQPLVLNSTTKVAARYFPPGERTTAISVGSAAQFVGILAAALTGGALHGAGGLPTLLRVHAAVAVVAGAAVLAAVRVPAGFAVTAPAAGAPATGPVRLRPDRTLWLLAGLLFVGVGAFNAVATWLETILDRFGHGGSGGGLIALMTVAGIAGSAVLPALAARHEHRRAMLLVTSATTVLVLLSVAVVHDLLFVGAVLTVEGFVLLAGLPVCLDWSEVHAGPEQAGTATGFLLLAGNLGGAVLVVLVQVLVDRPALALAALAAAALPGVACAAGLPRRAVPVP